tara:strand:+ start:1095 stop:1427 length:333 start_codon:yes stop_codon:yes gene_type:complete
LSGRGKVKSLDFDMVISATTAVLNSLPKDQDHLAEPVYNLIAEEYERLEGSNRKHFNEYPIKRFSSSIKTTRLKELGWRRVGKKVLTNITHKGKLIKWEKLHFRYIGDDE